MKNIDILIFYQQLYRKNLQQTWRMLYVKEKLEINVNYVVYLMNFNNSRPARQVAAPMQRQKAAAATLRSRDGFGWEILTLASPSKL